MFYSIFQVQGRLGNKMWSYATLLAAKQKYGYRVFMEESDLEELEINLSPSTKVKEYPIEIGRSVHFSWIKVGKIAE